MHSDMYTHEPSTWAAFFMLGVLKMPAFEKADNEYKGSG